MRKKILFVITKATWGGAQRYVYDLATHLPKEQFEVVVAYGEPGKLSKDLTTAGIRILEITDLERDVAIVSDVKSFFQIWNLLKKEQPDIVHLNSSKAAALGALAARLLGIKRIIFTIHGWPFKEQRNFIATKIIYFVSWFTAFLSDAVIVVSKEDQNRGDFMWGLKKKITYIPIGIQPPEFLSRVDAAASLSISGSAPRIVTIAELTKNKGIVYAIEAVAILKDQRVNVSYFIISDGEERERLSALAQKLDVSDRVHLLGFVLDAARYLRAFDIFVLPSIKEGMPYVLLEAAFADLPIITTNVVDPEFLHHYPSVRSIEPANSTLLATAIHDAIGNKTNYPDHPTLEAMIAETSACYTTAPTISVSSRA